MTVTMWEVRAADGRLEDLLAWLLPQLAEQAQVYRSAAGEPRVVVLDPIGEVTGRLAGVPTDLIARPAHAWQFEPVSSRTREQTNREQTNREQTNREQVEPASSRTSEQASTREKFQ